MVVRHSAVDAITEISGYILHHPEQGKYLANENWVHYIRQVVCSGAAYVHWDMGSVAFSPIICK